MNTAYLINEVLLFEPNERRLCSLQDYPARCFTLHGPVSECLNQLLKHNGEVLSQRFLFDAVWGKQGTIVTTNALYQVIATIRKSLKLAGLPEDAIKTIPKIGFKFNANVREGISQDLISSAIAFSTPSGLEDCQAGKEQKNKWWINSPLKGRKGTPILYLIFGMFFCLSCLIPYELINNNKQNVLFSHYRAIGIINNCEIYSSWHDIGQSIYQFMKLSERHPIDCKPGQVAYLTMNRLQEGVSVVLCNNTDKVDVSCKTVFSAANYLDSL